MLRSRSPSAVPLVVVVALDSTVPVVGGHSVEVVVDGGHGVAVNVVVGGSSCCRCST